MPCIEAVIKFKWNKYARKRFYWKAAVRIVFIFVFILAVSGLPATELHTIPWRKGCLLAFTPFAIIGLLYEALQWLGESWDYWNPYNVLDLASLALPLVTSMQVWFGLDPDPPLLAFAVILLWVHFLFTFRIFEDIGIFIAVVIEIIGKVVQFLFVLIVILFGFANAFSVLLGYPPDQNVSNGFTNVVSSFKYVFYLLTGDTGAFASFDGSNATLDVLRVIFSFTTVVILLNVLIALLNEVYSSSKEKGRESWLYHRAKLIAEMEIYLMSPAQRKDKNLFPDIIFYEGHPENVKEYANKIHSDSENNNGSMRELMEKVQKSLEIMEEQQRSLLEQVAEEKK